MTIRSGRDLSGKGSLRNLLCERELFVFDLDGTIADTSALHARAFARVLAPFGGSFHYPDYSGMGTHEVVSHFLTSVGISIGEQAIAGLVAAKQLLARELIANELEPVPGVDRFLSWCAITGRRVGMVTSGSAGTVAITLRRLGYVGRFDPLVTADDVGCGKPDPEGYRLVLRRSGFDGGQAVAFEDAAAGIAAATTAGLECIDVRVHSWTQLLECVA